MFTVWFDANGLRPDYGRFTMQHEAVAACRNLIARRFPSPMPLHIRVRRGQATVFSYNRPAGAIQGTGQAVAPWPELDVPRSA